MIQSIKKTLKRLSGKIYIFNPINWYPKLLEGLSIEFNRVREFKDKVFSSTVANANMDADSIDDYNKKYGIPTTLVGTDTEKIARIIEKAALDGYPGKDFLQDQIQAAGFLLYVHESELLDINLTQWGGTTQWGAANWGFTSRFVDPATIPGKLVVSSPPGSFGKKFLTQWGGVQWGGSGIQWGTPDPLALNPQPQIYKRTTDSSLWGFYFTLSPFPDRLATGESEFLSITQQELDYLCQIIIELKLLRNWCILQAKAV